MNTMRSRRQILAFAALLLAALACNQPFGSAPATQVPTEEAQQVLPVDRLLAIRADSATLRSGPGVKFESQGNLSRGEVIKVTGETQDGDWLRIALTPEQGGPGEAWISSELAGPLEAVQSPTEAMPPSSSALLATDTLLPTTAVEPSLTPRAGQLVPTNTATPGTALITATIATNCRAGTSTVFKVLGYLTPADMVEVRGRSPDGHWWYIQNPERPNQSCWVWDQTTVVTGNLSAIPIVKPPPTPIPVDTPTATLTVVVTGQP